MSDLIDRQAAIDALGEDALWDSDDEYETGMHTQWSMDVDAIKALPSVQPDYKDGWIYTGKKAWEFEPCEDTISRQAAIDAVTPFDDEYRIRDAIEDLPSAQPDLGKYEYHYDHTDCIWYRPEARNRCPVTCAQYRDGWNDAMNYIFRNGKGYRPYRRGKQYEE